MPRVRGIRDLRAVYQNKQRHTQLDRLLLSNNLRITTSKLSASAIQDAVELVSKAHSRRMSPKKHDESDPQNSSNDGYIVAVKDNFVTRELPTTCASHILEGFSAKDATAVQLMKEAGMAVVAKTNMDEFGMGSHSTHSAYGAVTNGTLQDALSVGGSSGGSALAVATRLVDCALGSDTGGSVRLPAAYTGIVGFKPSYGVISRQGLVPYANSLDTVGMFGRSCLDVWFLFRILAKFDSKDPTSLSIQTRQRIRAARDARIERRDAFRFTSYSPAPDRDSQQSQMVQKWSRIAAIASQPRRIGVPVEYNIEEMHPSVRNAWVRTLSSLQYLGHEIVPVSLPSTQQALSAYYVLAPAEASSNLAKYDGVRYGRLRDVESVDDAGGTLYSEYRGALFGEEVQRRILLGSFTLSAGAIDNYFIQAQKVRRIVQNDFDMVFRMSNPLRSDPVVNTDGVDYIVCPTAPTPPPRLVEVKDADPLDSYVNDVFTVPASLAGLPAISVPAYQDVQRSGDLEQTIGMQVIGQFGDDLGVIHFARRWMEQGTDSNRKGRTHEKRPKFR